MAGFFDSLMDAVTGTIVGKASSAVNNKVGQKIDQATEYARRLGKLKTFCSRLVGMTEPEAVQKCAEHGLRLWAIRRDDRDFSFNGKMEKRHDRVLIEVDQKKITKAYLG